MIDLSVATSNTGVDEQAAIRIEPLTASHMERFPVQNFPLDFWEGHAVVAVRGDEVLGICGAYREGDDIIVGMILTDELRRNKFFLHRSTLKGIEALKLSNINRIIVRPETDTGANWLRRLGFVHQGDDWVKWLQHRYSQSPL